MEQIYRQANNPSPLFQAFRQQSFAPIRNAFTTRGFGQSLTNQMTNPASAMGRMPMGKVGLQQLQKFTKKQPYFKLSPNAGNMLKTYSKNTPNFKPTFKYSNGWGIFNNTRPENIRALAASYLTRLNK